MPDLDLLNIDTDKLFEQHSISEIAEIHKKIQVQLDKKRQELRYMVGERYRDVITAADAIKTMQKSAEKLYTHIGHINEKCHTLQNNINIEDTKPVVDKVQNFYRSVAIQIKILISIPEYIWMCLDSDDFLKAVHLYLFAIHIHTGLELDTEHKVAETFTILSRLRLSVNSFRHRILDGIKKRLQSVKLSPEEASNHLCAYMLLENQSQQNIITKFIELRQNSLQELLTTDISVHSVVRVQIINLINCLTFTIQLIHSCFIDHNKLSDGLVQVEMKKILSTNAEKTIKLVNLETTPLLEYLPTLVSNFRPSCTAGETSVPKNVVQSLVKSWLEWTTDILKSNLSKSLDLITSVKALQTIREEALNIELVNHWDSICIDMQLPKNFTVWYYFFQPLVSERAEKLICRRIGNSLQYLYSKIENTFASTNISEPSEKDLRWYVWTEEPQDLSKNTNNHAGLAMKTKGHSVKIVSLCQEMDLKYLELLQDVNIYLYGNENGPNSKTEVNSSESKNERKHLERHLRNESSISVEKLISHVEELISSESDSSIKVIKTVMAARLLQALPQLCSYLVKSCSYGGSAEEWEQVHGKLTNHALQFWNNWISTTQASIEEMLSNFLTNVHCRDMLQILPRWSEINIQEQTEEKVFNSQIHIPAQPSVALLSILSEISNELNAVLPHTLPKLVHSQFTEGVAQQILERYERISLDEALNQNQALQFLLDVKFVSTICVKRESKELLKKSQHICDNLRAKIDPFDLDVFYPYLQTNVKRAVLQSQIMFGCFLPAPSQLASLGSLEKNTENNEPSVLAASVPNTDAWFPLLPVTAPILKTLNITPILTQSQPPTQTPKRETTVTKDEPESSSGTTFVRSGAAALFGAMTNDWFS